VRSGPIRPEVRTSDVDRRGISYALWEQLSGASLDLPWAAAATLGAPDVAPLLCNARTAVLVAGRGGAAATLLEHALANVTPSCHFYIYGSRTWETDARIRPKLESMAERALPRLGFEAPADWLVVDGGRAALLLLGPAGDQRRWILPLDGPLARTLYEASRVLFWFHATREGLPDGAGTYAFRTPLPAPFPPPGNDIALASGRLVIDGNLPDAVVDAEIRLVKNGAVPGRTGIVFLPPNAKDFSTPMRLAGGMTRTVWIDTGLPQTTISRERLVIDLVEAPVHLQLEWPRKDAIDIYHRLSKSAQKPEWQFHAQRRLADVTGPVLLEGAGQTADVKDYEVIEAPDVFASLETFDHTQPDLLPEPPPLARRVTYKWTVFPKTLPAGAREAELVRHWRTVDEWARRQVDTLRQALVNMEGEERGLRDRLRAWLSGHDELRQRRSRLRELLEELGEAPPSQHSEEAADLVRRIADAGHETREIIEQAHIARQKAEESAAEAAQRTEWEVRTHRKAEELAAKRAELGPLEAREAAIASELEAAEAKLDSALGARREARKLTLEEERDRTSADLNAARYEREAQTGARKKQRKELARKVSELEQRVARVNQEIDSVRSWSPPAPDLVDERGAASRARIARDGAREATKTLASEIRHLESLAVEPFVFKAPAHPAAPALPEDSAAPSVPDEALAELGELFEHGGKRYLAVKTWEQVQRAVPVAHRLDAELVSMAGVRK
jgi:hypothetical protein